MNKQKLVPSFRGGAARLVDINDLLIDNQQIIEEEEFVSSQPPEPLKVNIPSV